MNKKLLAAAVVGALASPVAFAQTLYGIVDVGYQNVDNGADDVNQDFIVTGQHSSSRLGVRGSEDLAGGLYAMYQIEFDIQADTGATAAAGMTHRLTFVGLGSKQWGELTLGRQYTHVFHSRVLGLSAGTSTFGTAYGQQPGTTRASNSIKYSSPAMSGFSVGAIWAPGLADQSGNEATATGADNNYWDAAIRWTPGPFGAAAAYGVQTAEAAGVEVEDTFTTFSAYWDNRAFGIYGNYTLHETDNPGAIADPERTYMSISGVARFGGNNEIHVHVGEREDDAGGATAPTSTFWGVSFVHRLSKRTLTYVGYGSTDNEAGIAL
ncbi:MAG TPA: porin, partial [Vicinamibacterales bacterium]|nr:porin [Vicinamibacterales bacterium]